MSLTQRLNEYKQKNVYPFHMPGHKRRLVPYDGLKDAYDIDITEIDGFDNLHAAEGIILEAQNRTARLYGADNTYFLVNGTTAGILAGVCANVSSGDYVIMARNCHKCVYNAVMLSGATPVYVYPKQEAYFEINAGISPKAVREAIESVQGKIEGHRVLVVITSPTYEGVVSDIAGIKEVCNAYNATLLVDGAHGAHFGFSKDFPQSAHSLGADIEVTSVHKTLPSPTQTALLHISDKAECKDSIAKWLSVFETSSPSYILMAGIDSCMEYLEANVDKAFKDYSDKLDDFISFCEGLNNISLLTADKLCCGDSVGLDKGKIVISDRSGRFSGRELYNILLDTYQLQPEMAAGSYVLLMTSIADDNKGMGRLKEALSLIDKAIDERSEVIRKRNIIEKLYDKIAGKRIRQKLFTSSSEGPKFEMPLDEDDLGMERIISAKDIMFEDKKEWIPVELCENKIAADYVLVYPPGIPLVAPGERITGQVVDKILEAQKLNLNVMGINENREIEVLWE